MAALPIISTAIISFKKINNLKAELHFIKQNTRNKNETLEEKKFYNFKNLEFRQCEFSYGNNQFSVGPVDLYIERNSVTFIFGGNGAGKTTFINAMLKLYSFNESGEILVDGKLVSDNDMNSIKSLYVPIFSDFYLFDALYGIEEISIDQINFYLKLFELEGKVDFIKDEMRFSTIDLSTGQRKRLALIYSILEKRPILVLDEWAADQDPHFRNKFYTEIIPTIVEKEDVTIVAITHDDKYYKYADQLFKMEYGKVEKVNMSQLNSTFNMD